MAGASGPGDFSAWDSSYSQLTLSPGEKAALFYHREGEMVDTVAALLRDGTERNELCVVICKSDVQEFRDSMKRRGMDPAANPGTVLVPQSHVAAQAYTPDMIAGQMATFVGQAKGHGYSGARLILDVPAELADRIPDPGAWMELDRQREELGMTVVILYDLCALPTDLLLRSLASYPLVIIDGMLCHNFHYWPEGTDEVKGLYDQLNQIRTAGQRSRRSLEERRRLEEINSGLQEEIVRRGMVEFALLQAENNLRTMLDAMSDMVFMVDRDLRVTNGNLAFIDFLARRGLDTAFEGKLLHKVIPGIPDGIRGLYDEVFRTGVTTVTEESFSLGDGRFEAEIRRVPVFKGDRVEKVVIITRFMPVQSHLRPGMWEFAELLKAAVAQPDGPLKGMLDKCPHPLLVHDRQGGIVDANLAALQMFGMEREEVKRCKVEDLVITDASAEGRHRKRHLHDGRVSMPVALLRKDGGRVECNCYISTLGEGESERVISVFYAR